MVASMPMDHLPRWVLVQSSPTLERWLQLQQLQDPKHRQRKADKDLYSLWTSLTVVVVLERQIVPITHGAKEMYCSRTQLMRTTLCSLARMHRTNRLPMPLFVVFAKLPRMLLPKSVLQAPLDHRSLLVRRKDPITSSRKQIYLSQTDNQLNRRPTDNGSDDSDDGLFAVPLFNKTQSSDSASQATKREGKPTLEVNTDVNKRAKTVAFKSPGSSAGIHNDSSRYSGPDDGSVVSDMSAADRSHSDSANTSSPDDRMGRRESFVSDIWANRPAVENVVNHLDEFFPGVDLDMPFMETKPDSQPSSASEATETRPTSLRGKVTYGTEGLPLDFTKRNESDTLGSDESTLKAKDRGTITNVAQRQKDKIGGLSRMKSIREVAKVRNDTNRGPSSSAQAPPTRGGGGLLRRKSTKMFGANIVQIKPKPGNRLSTLDPIPQEEVPTEDTPKRQATFKIIRGQLIGKGTYGRVYLGMNATTGEFLAVKHVEVNAKVAGQDRDRIKELVAAMDVEIDTMQHLEHPNIVQYLGCERRELSISIYLEYIPGGSIGSCLRKHGRFEEPVVRSLTRQTLEGLAYLHGQGILHRDLKADNILLDLDGTCKISDFGISKRSDRHLRQRCVQQHARFSLLDGT